MSGESISNDCVSLVYEIYSIGKEPFKDAGCWNLKALGDHYAAKNACPQKIPPNFRPHVIEIIQSCWKLAISERATMTDIACIMEKVTNLKAPVYVDTRHQAAEKKKMLESMQKVPRKGSDKKSPTKKGPSKEPLEAKKDDEPAPPMEDETAEPGTNAKPASKEPVALPCKEGIEGSKEAAKNQRAGKDKERKKHKRKEKKRKPSREAAK